MNLLWTILMCAAVAVTAFVEPSTLLTTLVSSCEGALQLTFSFAAVYCVWLGFFSVMSESGASDFLARLLSPVVKKLFGNVDVEAQKYILLNMSANLIGVGNAATPSAVKAISILEKDTSGVACFATVMLFVLNATSLQVLPTTVMGLRASCGSLTPSDIILPTLVSSAVGTVCGVTLVTLFVKGKK